MLYRHKALNAFTIAICLCADPSGAQTARADDFDRGLKLYEKHDFQAASLAFERSICRWPTNPNILYYCALSSQKCGRVKRANELFEHVVANYPNTDAAQLAKAYLHSHTGTDSTAKPGGPPKGDNGKEVASLVSPTGHTSFSPYGKPNDFDSLPSQDKIRFERRGQHLFVDAEVNHRPLQMCFDTGSPVTCLTLSTLEALNIARPHGQPTGMVQGVGEDAFPSWQISVDLKVGNITRLKYPILVVDNPYPIKGIDDLPLLGQSFFASFEYTIDDQSKSILLSKFGREMSSISHTSADPWAVPFEWEGKSMVVKVEINGKPLSMIFDTGAYNIALNDKTVHELNVPVPLDSETGQSVGYGGLSAHTELDVDSIRLGPITKKNMRVVILSDRALVKPLLGLPFFGDYQYTIDNEHRLIHFAKH